MIIINGESSSGKNIILDSGFNFGQGAFETILIKKQPIFLKEHCKRINEALLKLNVSNSISEEYLKKEIEKYNIVDCVLKVIVTEKNIVLTTREISYKEEDYIEGFKIKISDVKRNPYSHMTYIKSLNYTDNYIERQKAIEEGYNEVIFLNTNEMLTEGSVSNIFFVIGEVIYTPRISCGLLPGIIREWVINNFKVIEGEFTLETFKKADEVILTNSIMGIMKVKSFEGYKTFKNDRFFYNISSKYINKIG